MARKCTVRVTTCDDCPKFLNDYPHFPGTCPMLDRDIPQGSDGKYRIPEDDCPLPNFSEEWDDET